MMVSLQVAKFQAAETHLKQAQHLYYKVGVSRGKLCGAAARAAAGNLAAKASILRSSILASSTALNTNNVSSHPDACDNND